MNMPCLSPLAYYKQVDTILEALEVEAKDKMRMAGQRVHSYMLKANGDETSDAVVDAAVLFVETSMGKERIYLIDWSCLCYSARNWRGS